MLFSLNSVFQMFFLPYLETISLFLAFFPRQACYLNTSLNNFIPPVIITVCQINPPQAGAVPKFAAISYSLPSGLTNTQTPKPESCSHPFHQDLTPIIGHQDLLILPSEYIVNLSFFFRFTTTASSSITSIIAVIFF